MPYIPPFPTQPPNPIFLENLSLKKNFFFGPIALMYNSVRVHVHVCVVLWCVHVRVVCVVCTES